MEIVNEEDLKRYAVIDMFDIIIWDSNNLDECELFYDPAYCRGIYDYKENKYIKENSDE